MMYCLCSTPQLSFTKFCFCSAWWVSHRSILHIFTMLAFLAVGQSCDWPQRICHMNIRSNMKNMRNGIKHYTDVIMNTMASHITPPPIVLFTQPFIQAQIKENIKAPRHWPLCGKFTGDRWFPRTKGQWRGKCFHLMTSSWNELIM